METQDFYLLLAQIVAKLRRRLLFLAGAFVLASAIGWLLADEAMAHMFRMVRQVIFISPTEAFVTKLKVALTLGLVISLPAFLYLAIGAIRTKTREFTSRAHLLLTAVGYALFLIGGAFCAFTVLPVGIDFLLGFATLEMQPLLSAGRFASFVLTCMVVFGLMFELPLAIMLLAFLGLITADTLRAKRRHAIVANFILAGLLTPSTDVISQLLLALPLIGLYEIGILSTRFCRRVEEAALVMPADQQKIYN